MKEERPDIVRKSLRRIKLYTFSCVVIAFLPIASIYTFDLKGTAALIMKIIFLAIALSFPFWLRMVIRKEGEKIKKTE